MAEDSKNSETLRPPIADPKERAASRSTGNAPKDWAALVPELAVSDIRQSLSFWCGLLGFEIAYERPDARFAYLVRGPIQVMLYERNGRWESGEMQRPFGRGINFQMTVDRVEPILVNLRSAKWPLYQQPGEAWYRVGNDERGTLEFLVQDPDGYLIRFAEKLGIRAPARG